MPTTSASRRARAARVGNVRWVRMRAEELPADLGEFRLATFAQSFHWMDGDRVGSERLSRVVVRLAHEGETLHFDFTGSSPQVDAAVNCTYHATVAGAAVPIYTFLCQGDIDWNDGVKRCLKVT